MATIIHILLTLIVVILHAFAMAFLTVFSRILTAVLASAAAVILLLALTGTIRFGVARRSRK